MLKTGQANDERKRHFRKRQPRRRRFFDPQAQRKEESGLYVDIEFNKVKRGDEINLTQKDPTFKQAVAALGWDLKKLDAAPPDLDASIFLLDINEKTRVDEDFVFYNNLSGCEGAIKHTGDNRTGAGDGDDETVFIDLEALPFDVLKVVFVVSIYDMDLNDNDFTMVKNVYFRLVNKATNHEILRFELDEELEAGSTGLIVGEMERVGAEWIFRAIGETVEGGLSKIADDYGIVVAQKMQA